MSDQKDDAAPWTLFDLGLGRGQVLDEQVPHPGNRPLRSGRKRFYKETGTRPEGDGYAVTLDGKTIKTPARSLLVVPAQALAEAIADEWGRQGEFIDPRTMWLTKLANTAIDLVSLHREAVIDELLSFAGSDLLCYRASTPMELAERQQQSWGPVLEWAETALGASLVVTDSILPVTQPDEALARLRAAVAGLDAARLAALHTLVTLTGSALVGLAVLHRHLDEAAAFEAAHLDNLWQLEQWGDDDEESVRLETRRAEMAEAVRFLHLLDDVASSTQRA
ncbi:MAG: ATPase [Parvibaculaceae bacterium]|nr:ATPase [Parvibaculaceae bacterium]